MMLYETIRARIEQRGVHPELGPAGEGWWIEQNPDELATFLVWCAAHQCKSLLEVGAGHRHGLARFLVNDLGWTVVSIDKKAPVYREPRADLLIADTSDTDLCHLLLHGRRFDVVLIDADHSYEAVQRDFETFGGYADKAIAVHDIAGLRNCEGAAQFWQDMARDGEALVAGYQEAIASSEAAGLGWLDVSAVPVYDASDAELIREDTPAWDALTIADLRGMAERRGLALKSRMTKAELVALLDGDHA